MTHEEKAAYVHAQAVAATAEIEGMKAMNTERERNGYALAYDEAAFFAIVDKFGLGHNTLMEFFHADA